MKIRAEVCLTKQPDVLAVVCDRTGIIGALAMPRLGKSSAVQRLCLEYVHPLSYPKNAKDFVKACSVEQMMELEANLLAGLVLAIYEPTEIITKGSLTASEANALLAQCAEKTLVDVLKAYEQIIKHKDMVNVLMLDQGSFDQRPALKGWLVKALQDTKEATREDRIKEHNILVVGKRWQNGTELLSKAQSLKDRLKEEDAEFKALKAEALAGMAELQACKALPDKLEDKMLHVLQKENIKAVAKLVQEKLISRLLEEQAKTSGLDQAFASLLRFVKEAGNKGDPFEVATLDRAASDSLAKPKASLADILARKRGAL